MTNVHPRMATVSNPLSKEARSIFDDLGYSVSDRGAELRATRDWKEVRVTPVTDTIDAPDDGRYRCFVTWKDRTEDLERSIDRTDPTYEWALIGIDDDGEYEVVRAPSSRR